MPRHRLGSSRRSEALPSVTPDIPDRLSYRIGEVARICGVATSVLRFWETQFPQLKPSKGGTGQRLYRRRELELALRIHELVHLRGFTLAGARQAIAQTPDPASSIAPDRLEELRVGLAELRDLLARDPAPAHRRRSRPALHSATEPSLFADL